MIVARMMQCVEQHFGSIKRRNRNKIEKHQRDIKPDEKKKKLRDIAEEDLPQLA